MGLALSLKAFQNRIARLQKRLQRQVNAIAHQIQWQSTAPYDLVFVTDAGNKGWILDAICHEIEAYFPGRVMHHYSTEFLPPASAYFFSHYSLYPTALKTTPQVANAKTLVFYTHPKPLGISDRALIEHLNTASKVICMGSRHEKALQAQGLNPERSTFIVGGADPELFLPHVRSNGVVGFCTAYYERKDPDRILNIIQAMPHRSFMLLGKRWQDYKHFELMQSLENFTYIEAAYRDYPNYYAQMDVFVSAAKLEGGPIPLIEAMMSNVFPVASDTGFSPDIIRHGDNGFLFDVEAPIEEICDRIDQAFTMTTDVRETVKQLSWKNFSRQVQKLLEE